MSDAEKNQKVVYDKLDKDKEFSIYEICELLNQDEEHVTWLMEFLQDMYPTSSDTWIYIPEERFQTLNENLKKKLLDYYLQTNPPYILTGPELIRDEWSHGAFEPKKEFIMNLYRYLMMEELSKKFYARDVYPNENRVLNHVLMQEVLRLRG